MENNNLQLTAMETKVLESLIDNLYAEPGFSDVDANDLSAWTKISTRSIRGVLSSLVKKDIISIDDNDCGYMIVNLRHAYWNLHPRWKEVMDEPCYNYYKNNS